MHNAYIYINLHIREPLYLKKAIFEVNRPREKREKNQEFVISPEMKISLQRDVLYVSENIGSALHFLYRKLPDRDFS